MTAIDEIKARIDIVDLVSESVQLRRSGKSYSGFCPFHENKRTPAFAVFPESGSWRCFGQCNEGGDIFKFVMKKENCDFSEALRILAERAGVQLKPPSAEEQAAAEEHDNLRALLEEAVTFYRHQLMNTPPGAAALEYLMTQRGLSQQTIEAFGLGYAPLSWDATRNYFISKGYLQDDIMAAGMLSQREDGNPYDRFRHRVMFPIRDERGRMAGFGARILNPEDIPKFLNSPQTPVFDKGGLLYGLDLAKKSIRTLDQVVIVEGYLDVIALHQAGFTNVVSPMGTALTEHQLRMLKRFSRRIVLALDPDAAGDQATLRGLQVARQTLDREQDPVFDARGLLGHEARLQADIRVTTLPAGQDPDEIVQQDPQAWERIIKEARPIVMHVMETLAAEKDLDDPKVKTEIAAQVLPLIEDVPSPVERDTYRQRLARLLRVSEQALLGQFPAAHPRSRLRPRPRTEASRPGSAFPGESSEPSSQPLITTAMSTYTLESHCLGVLLRFPELLYQVDRHMQQDELPRLSPADFQHLDHQTIMRLFIESIDQDQAEPKNFVLNHLSLPLMEMADGLLARTQQLDPNQDRVLEDLMRSLLSLRRRMLDQEIEFRRFEMQVAHEQGDLIVTQDAQNMVKLSKLRKCIDRAIDRVSNRSLAARDVGQKL